MVVRIIIILSFICVFIGGIISCRTEAIQMKSIRAVYIDKETHTRWLNGGHQEINYYYYRGEDKVIYQLEVYLGERSVLYVRR
jgi:hypothetical protein